MPAFIVQVWEPPFDRISQTAIHARRNHLEALTMPIPILPASDFRAQLQVLLQGASREALEMWILEYGEQRPARERTTFLETLQKRLKASGAPKPPKARDLLKEIDGLLESLADGDYFAEEEWDEFGCHDDSDDSWAEEMDELFAEAQALCKAGDKALGAEALRRLLHGLALESQDGVFGGDGTLGLLETDLDAATFLYLRTVLDLAPQAERIAALVDAAEGLYHVPKGFSFGNLGSDLPNWNELVTYLDARGPAIDKSFDAWETWLPEALLASGGATALLEYLRRIGYVNHGAVEAFLKSALAKKDWPDVAEVALGAIRAHKDDAFSHALTPLAVEACRRTGKSQAALDLAERRFLRQRDTWSLLAWLSEGDGLAWRDRLTRLAADPTSLKAPSRGEDAWSLLLTPWDLVKKEVRAERLPWLSITREDRGFTLLAAAAQEGLLPVGSRLHKAWHEAFRPQAWHAFGAPTLWKEPVPSRTCADLLAWKLVAQPLSADDRAGLRRELGQIVLDRARGVLKTNSRKQYPFAARQLVLVMELHERSGELGQASALRASLLTEFPRHRAFHEDLALALGSH